MGTEHITEGIVTESIYVGTNILLGNIVNTNASYLAGKLGEIGLSCYYQTIVGANEEHLEGCIKQALERADIVFLCGGLGLAPGDITKKTVADVLKRSISQEEIDGNTTLIIENSIVLQNTIGKTTGAIIEENGKYIVLLPGHPSELKRMYEAEVAPFLKEKIGVSIYYNVIKVCSRKEEEIRELLKDFIPFSGEATVSILPKYDEIHIKVTAKGETEKDAKKIVKPVVKEIKERIGNDVYTTHEEVTLEQSVVELLRIRELTVTTAESCTGGMLAARLISVPGASEVYQSGQITYSNRAKRKFLGVKKKTLDKYGAVSSQTVKEMALGAIAFNHADVAVSISGLAGPDGGTDEKPVGLVYIGCCVCGQVTAKEYHFKGDRQHVRECAVTEALILMRNCIEAYEK